MRLNLFAYKSKDDIIANYFLLNIHNKEFQKILNDKEN